MATPDAERPILVVAAVQQELSEFQRRVPGFIETLVTGIGRDRARAAVRRRLASGSYQLVVSAGFAGAAKPGLRVGDLVVASEVVDEHTGRRFVPYGTPGAFRSIGGEGRFVTCGRAAVTPEQKAALGGRFDAAAVEMETAEVAQAAISAGVPWCAVRAILDPVDEALAVGSVGQALRMAAAPARWKDLSNFIGSVRTARRSLASGLVALVSEVTVTD